MLNDKKLEELREQRNVAVVIVSSDAQDVARQRSEFQRVEQTFNIQFEYIELKNRKRTQLDRAALDVLATKTKVYGDINQWRHDCSRYGTADTWERTKIAIKDKRKSGELQGKVKCFVLSPMPYEITDPTMDMQTKMLFQISTEEMKCLSKRILGAKRGQCLAGQHSGGDIPFPCDVVRSINGIETLRIHQIRATSSKMRKRDSRPKYELIFPNSGSKLCAGTTDDPLPVLKNGEKQFYVLTKDEKRVALIRELHKSCLNQDTPIIWHRLSKELNEKYGDEWGNGWTGNRIKNLMLNTAIMGKPSIGKTCHADLPSLIIRSKTALDGYEHNEEEVSGNMPEESWVMPEQPLFDLIKEEDFQKLKKKVFVWDTIRQNDLLDLNSKRKTSGLKPLKYTKSPTKYLRGLVWDVVDDIPMRITKNKLLCSIYLDHAKGKQSVGCGACLAIKPFERVLKDYFFLPDWNSIQDAQEISKLCDGAVNAQKMKDCVEQYLTDEEKSLYDSLEQMYEVALERSNVDVRANIEKLNKIISNLGYAIETCDNRNEIPSLRSRLADREKEKLDLEEQLAQSVVEGYHKDRERFVSLTYTIHKFCTDKIDNWELRDMFLAHDIKVFIDKSKQNGWYVAIKSSNPNLPSLYVSYEEWRKKYVSPSLEGRPQHFQKGHRFFGKQGSLQTDALGV